MQTVSTAAELRNCISTWKEAGEKIVFVPTMGNLHAGHLALIKHAQSCGGKIVCSIFVNPLQFDREEDLRTYPRTPEQDLKALLDANVDLVFMPEYEEVYSQSNQVEIPKYSLSKMFCGEFRPGFFEGILEVITRLFKLVTPDVAVFGEKDYQQLIIIKKLVADLDLPIQIEQVAIQREEDGLAYSSRNSYLNQQQRGQAAGLYATLQAVKEKIENGSEDYNRLENWAMQTLSETGFRPDYVAIRAAEDLDEPSYTTDFIVVLAAAWMGEARLIDNVVLRTA